MHYSPFSAGFGLLAIGQIPFGTSPFPGVARLLLDLAGAGFLVLGMFFIGANLYGSFAGRRRPRSFRIPDAERAQR